MSLLPTGGETGGVPAGPGPRDGSAHPGLSRQAGHDDIIFHTKANNVDTRTF